MSRSKYRSKAYPNLYRLPGSKNWVFRKYSKLKGREFFFSSGIADNQAEAYAKCIEAFNKWLGRGIAEVAEGGPVFFHELAREILDAKLALSDSDFSPNSKRRTKRDYEYLIEAFGNLPIERVNETLWEQHYTSALGLRRQTFFNRRKALIEIIRRAHREGLIQRMPDFKNPDPKPKAGKALDRRTMKKLLAKAKPRLRLLCLIMWKQGARPGEVLRYRWDMIDWKASKHGILQIPAEITKTRRARRIPLQSEVSAALRRLEKASKSPWLFPKRRDPSQPMRYYNRSWERLCLAVGHEGSIYDIRRTFCTERLDLGASIEWVAQYCDSSPAMIRRFYSKPSTKAFERIIG